jgi:ketosteroid isomerase-like protein
MKLVAFLCGILLLATSSVQADDTADIRGFVVAYDRAYLSGDTAALGAMLAPEFRVVSDGVAEDREGSLADYAAHGQNKLTGMSSTVDRIHVDGDLAVVIGRVHWRQANDDGTEDNGSEHFTLVLAREAGQWKALAEHVSEVVEKDKP